MKKPISLLLSAFLVLVIAARDGQQKELRQIQLNVFREDPPQSSVASKAFSLPRVWK
jgi:hypothetical protein